MNSQQMTDFSSIVKRLLLEAWSSEMSRHAEEAIGNALLCFADQLKQYEGTAEYTELVSWLTRNEREPFEKVRFIPPILMKTLASLCAAAGEGVVTEGIFKAYPNGFFNQVWPAREAPMRAIIPEHFSRPLHALELGTWFGLGSTRIWLDTLPEGSSLVLVDCWSNFISEPDILDYNGIYRVMDRLPSAAFASAGRIVREYEQRRPDLNITLIRGRSREVLPMFKEGQFDFVYVDGSHYYDDVKCDLRLCKGPMNPSFSVICGDDLEVLPDDDTLRVAREHSDRDFIALPDGRQFHPGVLRAVAEEIPTLKMVDGFWWAVQRAGKLGAEPAAA